MRDPSPWDPHLGEGRSPSERLVAALAADILEGGLEPGARLPAHRDLAWRLGIGIGTVTKAYAVLERRGLTRSVAGRGTFVAAIEGRTAPVIDLSVNAPPAILGDRLLARTFDAMARRADPGLFALYPPAAGHPEHRRLMARWLAGLGLEADPARLVLTNGAQQALAIAFAATTRPSRTILTEAVTYPGAIALARHAGYRLHGLPVDGEGLVPEALDRALAGAGAPGLLYVTPTMHNPTTATMGLPRRSAVAEICRRHDVLVVEDDVYALAADADLPPLAALAPERVLYVNSLSKTLSPGLRIGCLVVPPALLTAAEEAIRATGITVSPLSCAVMEAWLADGTAASMRGSVRQEAIRRRTIATGLLGEAIDRPSHDGFHLWLPMERERAESVAAAALAAGVTVTPPAATMVDPEARASGLRLCLGAPSLADLTRGLTLLAPLVAGARPRADVRR